MSLPELPEGYYLENFEALCRFVFARYEDLLSAEEGAFWLSFQRLPMRSRRLYVRLLTRKGNCFRVDKLNYDDVGPLTDALHGLSASKFVDSATELVDVLAVCTKPELLHWLGAQSVPVDQLKRCKALRREALCAEVEQWLMASDAAPAAFLDAHPAIVLLQTHCFDVYKLLYFANLRQDLTDFVLRDLGIYAFENYPLTQDHRFFQSRAQIDAHLAYYQLVDGLDEPAWNSAESLQQLDDALTLLPEADRLIQRRVSRIRNKVARQLERLDEKSAAAALYSQLNQHPARERRARLYADAGDYADSLALCQAIQANPWCEEEWVFAQEFGHRTWKKWRKLAGSDDAAVQCFSGGFAKSRGLTAPPTQTLTLAFAPSVEQAVAEHYGDAWYVENGLFTGLLGLAAWDLVFADVPGAFFNPFQMQPLDFNEPDFLALRSEATSQLEARMSDRNSLTNAVLTCFHNKYGRANPLVYWPVLTEVLLQTALARIPIRHLRAIFRRILSDLKNHRSGLPDLIRFPATGSYELVEVKGPGDRLQKNQSRWMHFFSEQEIPHALVNVVWASGH